jgi:sterol desaturase/sphingolipid hydroxylase (fatty acid hydroxylase superfamily)
MDAAWVTFLREHVERLQGPGTLLYWPFIASAFVFTVGFLVIATGMRLGEALREVVSRRVWLTRSTRTDVVMTLTHEMFVAAPTIALGAYVSDSVFGVARRHLLPAMPAAGVFRGHAPLLVQSAVVTIAVMLAIDLGTFIAHRLHHTFPALWEMHAVHHSAEQLTLFTAHRLHPLEALLRAAVQGLVTGSVLAALEVAFGQVAPVISIWGLGAGFFLNSFTNNLLHSHVPVRYPRWLRRFVLSPHIHHLHHSKARAHRDRNFGAMFPYWDRLCGTYLDVEVGLGDVAFGLDDADDPFKHSLVRCYVHPFVAPFEKIVRFARRRRRAASPV